jgi:hypothetical protein
VVYVISGSLLLAIVLHVVQDIVALLVIPAEPTAGGRRQGHRDVTRACWGRRVERSGRTDGPPAEGAATTTSPATAAPVGVPDLTASSSIVDGEPLPGRAV